MNFKSIVASFKTVVAGTLAGIILGLLSRLIRWTYIFPANGQNTSQNVIITFWHGRILMMPWLYWKLRGRRARPPYMLISQHGDGRIIAIATRILGIHSVAGSSSRGGLRALLELIRVARTGADLGFTPDGPRGPQYEAKEGVVLAAAKTGCPIVLCAYSTKDRWQLRSWDGMIVPRPFSRGVCMASEPIYVSEGDDYEVARLKIQSALTDITKRADDYWSST
jgi:lysophospholipid acyltransferase (LPLAT)-like uncharacterized protein